MTTALITGAAGQDGVLLARELVSLGYRVVGGVRPGTGQAALLANVAPGVEPLDLDITDEESVDRALGDVLPDEVYHLAGVSSVGASWREPVRTMQVNAVGTAVVLERARRSSSGPAGDNGPRVVLACSGEVFDSDAGVASEETPFRPTSPYAVSKAACWQLGRTYRDAYGMHVSTAILFSHESPLRDPAFVTRTITKGVAELAIGRRQRLTLGNLDVVRDWGWAPDYVHALRLMAAQPDPGDYVVATGEAHGLSDLLRVAFDHAGLGDWRAYVDVDDSRLRPADPPVLIGDASRAREDLGWAPTRTFDEMVSSMVDHDLALIRDPSATWFV
ncbi:MAG: GDP-mannose 4,6-dehydratase [Candidatus Nanopelagicales bacterium]